MCASRSEAGSAPTRADEVPRQFPRLRLGAEHRAEQVHLGGHEQARRQRVRRAGREVLPGGDRRLRRLERPAQVQRRRRGSAHRAELQARHDAEAPAAGAPQRPEQVAVGDLEHPPVGQHDLGAEELVAGQPVRAPEDPQAAAERQPGDPHGRPAAAGDRQAVRVERVVDVAEPRAGADRRHPVLDAHGAHRAHVDEQPLRRRAPAEAVPAAARRHGEPVAAGVRERLGHVGRAATARDRLRPHVLQQRDRRPPQGVVLRRPGLQQ